MSESAVIGVAESAACVDVAPIWNDDDEPPASKIRWCIQIVEWVSVPCRKLGQSVAHSDAWFTGLSPDYHRTPPDPHPAGVLRHQTAPDLRSGRGEKVCFFSGWSSLLTLTYLAFTRTRLLSTRTRLLATRTRRKAYAFWGPSWTPKSSVSGWSSLLTLTHLAFTRTRLLPQFVLIVDLPLAVNRPF